MELNNELENSKRMQNEMQEKKSEFEEEAMIYSYTQSQAIEDGVLKQLDPIPSNPKLGIPPIPCCITTNMLESFRNKDGDIDLIKLNYILRKGILMLDEKNKEDSKHMKLRVIEKGNYWVILNGDGVTFLKPEDY